MTRPVPQVLPKFNRLGATAANYSGALESGLPQKPRETGIFQCPGPELNWRHVDFQSAIRKLTNRQETCGISAAHHGKKCTDLTVFEPVLGQRQFAHRAPQLSALASALGAR